LVDTLPCGAVVRDGENAMPVYDHTIIGGGIVGLATALMLGRRCPRARILVLEKEANFAAHQTGRNSGVIHSGIYYKPDGFKARFARAGNRSMVKFCELHGLPHEVCGKVIVATAPEELPGLHKLFERGQLNGLDVHLLPSEQVREIEPHVRCVRGLRVSATGIVSYAAVSLKYVDLIRAAGGTLALNARVDRIVVARPGYVLETTAGDYETRFVINCAGLHSDRVARLCGVDPGARIVPFRGEYYELAPEKRQLVNALIYPVPNPEFPFLGVHYTRLIDGRVHAGPNAVLAFKREGYRKLDFHPRDFAETMCFLGFWKMAGKNLREGWAEMRRSWSKTAFLRSLQRLIPEVQLADLQPAEAGVRAQALRYDGSLVDDFLMVTGRNSLHVCNAPSPAATASLEIGQAVAEQVPAPS
jgi:(S)-2-hydroxyglutarate dehydrogenase